MVSELDAGDMLCVCVPRNEHEPWMLGRAIGKAIKATADDVNEAALLGFTIKEGAAVLRLRKYEPFDIGSRRYVETKVDLVVPTSRLRRHKLQPNSNPRLSAKMKADARYGLLTFELKEADLRIIVALMAQDGVGDFKVAAIVGHRTIMQRGKPIDQFRVRWDGWDRDEDLTWEPLSHFTDAEHIAQCHKLREVASSSTASDSLVPNITPLPTAAASSTIASSPTSNAGSSSIETALPVSGPHIYTADI